MSFFAISYAQDIDVQDDNFKTAMVDEYIVVEEGDFNPRAKVDTNGDGEIQISEAEAVHKINIDKDYDITSLDGIQYFTNLESLYITGNHVADLDLSKNVNLKVLYIDGIRLENINLSQNVLLKHLTIIREEQLTSLDVSQNTNLTYIEIRIGSITDLDLSHNLKLIQLELALQKLTRLNLANGNNNALTARDNSIYSFYNPRLSCMQVDDIEWSTTNWPESKGFNVSAYSTDCFSKTLSTVGYQSNLGFYLFQNTEQNLLEIRTDNGIKEILIFDINGRVNKKKSVSTNQQVKINIDDMNKGIYIIKASFSHGASVYKKIVRF